MADFVLKKRRDFVFALEDDPETTYTFPSLKSLTFEEAKLMTQIDDEDDVVVKGKMIRDFILSKVPALADKGLSDMEYLEILNAYALSEGRESLGESKASPASSKSTGRR